MTHAHQPGSKPVYEPDTVPNPAVVPKEKPLPKEPVKVPDREKVPANSSPSVRWGFSLFLCIQESRGAEEVAVPFDRIVRFQFHCDCGNIDGGEPSFCVAVHFVGVK